MRRLRWSVLAALTAAVLFALPVGAAPLAQTADVSVTPARLDVYPLGTARIQLALSNPSSREQVFALEIVLVRADGSIARTHLTDALAVAPGVNTTATYTIQHADGAVEAIVTPRPWPELVP